MKHLIAVLLALAFVVPIAAIEIESTPAFTAYREFTNLSGAPFAVTLSVPAKSKSRVYLAEVVIWSTVQVDIEQTRNATVTGGSAITPVPTNLDATPTASVVYGATLANGSSLGTWTVPASQHFSLDVSKIVMMRGRDAAQSYTVKSSGNVTGTVRVAITYYEKD